MGGPRRSERGKRRVIRLVSWLGVAWSATVPAAARGETGYDAWLRYPPITDSAVRERYERFPAVLVVLGSSPVLTAARDELLRGVHGMLGRTLRLASSVPREPALVVGTLAVVARELGGGAAAALPSKLPAEAYLLREVATAERRVLVVAGGDERGALYGAFALLRKLALGETVAPLDETHAPFAPVRMLDQWDNLDGSIERGYAGPSIFFAGGAVLPDLTRVRDYARLMASVAINGCAINNVNADARLLGADFLPQLARVAAAFRPWGVRLFVAIDFSSPRKLGGLDTFDPLDDKVVAFWRRLVDDVYRVIPDFGGFVLKADSEGRLGPSAYGRTHADAANVIARPLAAHGGRLFYRGFIYDHHLDWRDPKNDRARAAYDNLQPLDGRFDDAAALQIKYGPIDFQVREPPSPLFGALEKTNQVIELQITQEYTGQQRHLCFLVPLWKEVLDFDLRARPTLAATPVKDLVAGKTFGRAMGGFVAVANVGRDTTWLGHDLAMANLFGFGRLAWDPGLSSRRIAEEWTRLTFGSDPLVVATIVDLQLRSWPAYENYTGPLGAGTLTDIIQVHYGPAPMSSEENGWGQWHRADRAGVGMDRTAATGTGFIAQYRAPVAARFESLATCPDDLLLFMHHVPYTYRLRSGRTVIQHIYDRHFAGAAEAADFVGRWRALAGRIDEGRFVEVLRRFEYQAGHAEEWRDAVDTYFFRKSGIPDAQGRFVGGPGTPRGRTESESMELHAYSAVDIVPAEAASGARAVRCPGGTRRCQAHFRFPGPPGWFDVTIRYFDPSSGVARFALVVAGQTIDAWQADDHLPSDKLDAHTSTRRVVRGVALRPDDDISIEGAPDGGDPAAFDYVEIAAAPSRPRPREDRSHRPSRP